MKVAADCSVASLSVRQQGNWSPFHLFQGNIIGAIYDPSAPGAVFSDVAGTLPASTAGDLVARIEDLSGNGNHLVQEDPLKRPAVGSFGNRRWLEFNGSTSLYSTATPDHWTWLHHDTGATVGVSAKVSFRTDKTEYLLGTASGSATVGVGLAIQSDNRSAHNIPMWARILIARGIAGEPAGFIGTPEANEEKNWILSTDASGMALDGASVQFSTPWIHPTSEEPPVHSLRLGQSGQNALIGRLGAVVVMGQSEKAALGRWLASRTPSAL